MHIAIIGNGISGVTAARWLRKKSDYKITLISSESKYFYSRTALMYIYMGHMKFENTKPYEDWFWEKNRIDLLKEHVSNIDFKNEKLQFESGESLQYDKLILALGSASNKFGWPGQNLAGVRGLYTLQDIEAMEKHSKNLKRTIIVGGGLIGLEMAEMFHNRHIPVTMLVREASYWDNIMPAEESKMISNHIYEHGIDLRLTTELKEIIDDGQGKACAVYTNQGERINCGFVGLTAGVHPNITFLKDTELEVQKGILVNNHLQTNIENVYAIGDCVQLRSPQSGRRSIEAVWYTGRMMGETVAYNICGTPIEYDPGIWFNSAKFLDLEYQVYGTVLPTPPPEHKSLIWVHNDGKKSIRIVYLHENMQVIGFNLMGIRFRHEVCEKWIKDKTKLHGVIEHLKLAHFDPEFYKTYEEDICRLYTEKTGISLNVKRDFGWNKVFNFINS